MPLFSLLVVGALLNSMNILPSGACSVSCHLKVVICMAFGNERTPSSANPSATACFHANVTHPADCTDDEKRGLPIQAVEAALQRSSAMQT